MTRKEIYVALLGPEGLRGELAKMLGTLPLVVGNGTILDNRLTFRRRRNGGVLPSLEPSKGGTTSVMVYRLQYYEQRRLERRLGYPCWIRRATYDGLIEDVHPIRVLAYYIPGREEEPGEELKEKMEELYTENAWDVEELNDAIKRSQGARCALRLL